jgi:hypothetical protein
MVIGRKSVMYQKTSITTHMGKSIDTSYKLAWRGQVCDCDMCPNIAR